MIVIGDIMLDRWIQGSAKRVSPEAPIPILKEEAQHETLGGAANVALNCSHLRMPTTLYGAVGYDVSGDRIKELLKNTYINLHYMPWMACGKSTTKTRFVETSNKFPFIKHVMRWDDEAHFNNKFFTDGLLNSLVTNDPIIISDYNKGVVTKELMDRLHNWTHYTFVDPKQHPETYRGAFLVKPNMKEYVAWNGRFDPKNADEFRKKYHWNNLVVTDSDNGIHLIDENGLYYHATTECEGVVDVAGAGDTVIAVLAWAVTQGWDMIEAVQMANQGATAVVQRAGVVPVDMRDTMNMVTYDYEDELDILVILTYNDFNETVPDRDDDDEFFDTQYSVLENVILLDNTTNNVIKRIPINEVLAHNGTSNLHNVSVILDRDILLIKVRSSVKTQCFVYQLGMIRQEKDGQ